MKLDRNLPENEGRNKYALILHRNLFRLRQTNETAFIEAERALAVLNKLGLVDRGETGTEGEFFVLRLKDEFALPALQGYATAVELAAEEAAGTGRLADRGEARSLGEYGEEVAGLASRAGVNSPWCKRPD